MGNANQPESCLLVETAQDMQSILEFVQPQDFTLVKKSGEAMLRAMTDRPSTLFVASEHAYYNNDQGSYRDVVEEHDLELLRVIGKLGWLSYFDQFESFTVTIQKAAPSETEEFKRLDRCTVLPSQLFIPVLDIIQAVAA